MAVEMMLLCILAFVLDVTNTNELDTSFTSQQQIEYQVDAGIKFMCINQYESNGQFLYETVIKKTNKTEFNSEENNIPRQAAGLYAIAMYYRLHYNKNKNNDQFSIIECIDNSIKYLKSISIRIDNNKNNGELIDGNTGATALGMLGMIEICIAEHDTNHANHSICNQYLDEFVLWLNGLITMRNKKLAIEMIFAKNIGAFSKNILKSSKSTNCYDSEAYLVFARMLQFKKYLYLVISDDDKLWNNIINIVNGLDEYYINYRLNYEHQGDTHWLVQSLFSRWITLKYINNNNNFMNAYMFKIIIYKKLNGKKVSLKKNKGRCFMMESWIDTIYAIQKLINNSKYQHNDKSDTLYIFKKDIWNLIKKRYKIITSKQLFIQNFNASFNSSINSSFNGAFFGDESNYNDYLRIDDTQHCNCALMKLNSLLYDTNQYMNDLYDTHDLQYQIVSKNQFIHTYIDDINHLSIIGLGCLFTVILLIINPTSRKVRKLLSI